MPSPLNLLKLPGVERTVGLESVRPNDDLLHKIAASVHLALRINSGKDDPLNDVLGEPSGTTSLFLTEHITRGLYQRNSNNEPERENDEQTVVTLVDAPENKGIVARQAIVRTLNLDGRVIAGPVSVTAFFSQVKRGPHVQDVGLVFGVDAECLVVESLQGTPLPIRTFAPGQIVPGLDTNPLSVPRNSYTDVSATLFRGSSMSLTVSAYPEGLQKNDIAHYTLAPIDSHPQVSGPVCSLVIAYPVSASERIAQMRSVAFAL